MRIYNLDGRLIKDLTAKQLSVKLDFPVGLYVVELCNRNYRVYEKIRLVK